VPAQIEQRELLHLAVNAFGAHQAISKIGFAGGVITGLSASDIDAATPPQRQAARKCSHNYYGTIFAFSGYYEINIYKTIAYEFILRIDARQMFNMG
jgi:hypothetical protein